MVGTYSMKQGVTPRRELYHLPTDPFETTNIAHAHAGVVAQLKAIVISENLTCTCYQCPQSPGNIFRCDAQAGCLLSGRIRHHVREHVRVQLHTRRMTRSSKAVGPCPGTAAIASTAQHGGERLLC